MSGERAPYPRVGKSSKPTWPENVAENPPYKGLEYFGRNDRLLLTGREGDIGACVRRLVAGNTRIFMLYGHTGSGKSSFLRAGLVPTLEEQELPYAFLSTRNPKNKQFAPYFVRCTARPLDQLARAVRTFVNDPYFGPRRRGRQVGLKRALLGSEDEKSFVNLCKDPSNLVQSIALISAKAGATLVIIVDQAEEILTQTLPGDPQRQNFFRFLNDFTTANLNVKLLLAIRTEHVAPFEDLFLARGLARSDVSRYQLRELATEQLREAIYRPASNDPARPEGVPKPPYNFTIDEDAVQEIVGELDKLEGHGGTLPVMQLLCKDLYERLPGSKASKGEESLPKWSNWPLEWARWLRRSKVPGEENRVAPREDWRFGSSRWVRRLLFRLNPWRAFLRARRLRRVPQSRNITLEMVRTAGGVAGRMAGYLEEMIRRAYETEGLSVDVETWEEALLHLVNLAPDGTASTQIVSHERLNKLLDDAGVPKEDRDRRLEYLCLPSVRVLRNFDVLNERSGQFEKRYSLGHDALALGLKEWRARRDNRKLRERNVRLGAGAVAFAIIAIAGVSAWPLIIRASDSVALAKKYVDAAVRVLSTQPEVAVAIGAEAAHKISSLDWLAWLLASSTEETLPRLLTQRLEAVVGALPEQIFPSAGDDLHSTSLTLIGASTVISRNDGGAATGDPANFASATDLPDYDPGPLGFYSARYLGKHLAFAEDVDLVYFDAGLSKNARWNPADTEVARLYSSLGGSDSTLYFEQDFLQYYDFIPTGDEVPAALPFYDLIDTRDSAASLHLSAGLYANIDPDSMTARADRRSLGVVRYVGGSDPESLGDLYVGNTMVSWNGKPESGAATFSVFDAFDQGDLFISPISSKDGMGKRIAFDAGALDSHDFTKEPLALKDELTAKSFDGDLVNFLAACNSPQREPVVRTRPERQCTVQSPITPVASPVLLLIASPRVSTDKTGLAGTTPPPAESDTSEPGCNSGVCFGLVDIENRTFEHLPNTKLWAKPVAGDPSAVQFVVGSPATGQPGLDRIALWSEWGPSINVVSLSSGDTIDQRPDDGTYAPLLLPRWAEDRITAAFFSDDGDSLLAEISNRVVRWTLRPDVGILSLAAIEALFCEERDRRFTDDMIAPYNKEVDLAPGTTPENNCSR